MYGCKPVATPLVTNEKLMKKDGSKKASASIYRSLIGSLLPIWDSNKARHNVRSKPIKMVHAESEPNSLRCRENLTILSTRKNEVWNLVQFHFRLKVYRLH